MQAAAVIQNIDKFSNNSVIDNSLHNLNCYILIQRFKIWKKLLVVVVFLRYAQKYYNNKFSHSIRDAFP